MSGQGKARNYEITLSSAISELIIFSGGGGIVRRKATVTLEPGTALIKLDGIPVSFNPETLEISITPETNRISQFTTKKATRKYIDEQLRQEAQAARNVINASVNVGGKRGTFIKEAEEVIKRDYLDEYADISITVETGEANAAEINYSFIIEDLRLNWSPFITIKLLDGDQTQVKCLLTINNQTATSYDDVEVKFAEFDLPREIDDLDDGIVYDEAEEGEIDYSIQRPPAKVKKWSKQVVQNRMLF
ncbi:MAG: hypothetical protein ACFFD4_37150 [Candidatus Odinarchaeota archaeon]